jgi:hypothetical protein
MAFEITTTKEAEAFLKALADELEISEARYEQAYTSYKSFGGWLSRPESTVRQYKPNVYVQGSFRLGTVIKPISENEDYDVDAVSQFDLIATNSCSQKTLKDLLGTEVKAYHRHKSMTKPVREGRRCWVLDYADGAQFHMDIVPAVPDAARLKALLEERRMSSVWSTTSIAITDNERWNYALNDADWCRSNPKGYAEWFQSRMKNEFESRRRVLAESVKKRVEDIPDYRVRTPLQSAIMILKRHRDWRFANDLKNKPISIILTTLAAHAYQSEPTIGRALISILKNMDSFIKVSNGKYVIENPSDPLENFADKWAEFPERAQSFFDWLKAAREDFTRVAIQIDRKQISEGIEKSFGKSLIERATRRLGGSSSLLMGATAAPASGYAFENKARVPSNPSGFA